MLVLAQDQLPKISLADIAAELGLDLLLATSLAQAIEIYRTHLPQIILLPVVTEGQTTLSFTKTCLKANPDVQIIVVVNRNQINEAAEAMRLGVADCLFTPFPHERLLKTLSAVISRVDTENVMGLPDFSSQKTFSSTGQKTAKATSAFAIGGPDGTAASTNPPVNSSTDTGHASHLLAHFHGLSLAQIERVIIEEIIRSEAGSVTRAAKTLKVAPSTLYRKIENWRRPES